MTEIMTNAQAEGPLTDVLELKLKETQEQNERLLSRVSEMETTISNQSATIASLKQQVYLKESHQKQDAAAIAEAFNQDAVDRDDTENYDGIVESLNMKLNTPLPVTEREKDWNHKFTVEVSAEHLESDGDQISEEIQGVIERALTAAGYWTNDVYEEGFEEA